MNRAPMRWVDSALPAPLTRILASAERDAPDAALERVRARLGQALIPAFCGSGGQTGRLAETMGLRVDPSVFPKSGFDEVTRPGETRIVVLGGGLFWCADALYRLLAGVVSVRPGYAGGAKADASFEAVHSGATEHAFVVELVYEPATLSLGQILQVFFSIAHDPTLRDRKAQESANPYRSVVYYTSEAQRTAALDYIRRLQRAGVFDALILTDVSPLSSFYEAEPVHHDYAANHPKQHHVRMVSIPKLLKLKKLHGPMLKPQARLAE